MATVKSLSIAAAGAAFTVLGTVNAAQGITMTFAQNLAGFNAAVSNPLINIDFDDISPGTNITGTTISGLTFFTPSAPLIVTEGATTYTPFGFDSVINPSTNQLLPTSGRNVLSPGGANLAPGSNDVLENDDLTLVFTNPVSAFGFDHISQSADGWGLTNIQVFDSSNSLLFSGTVPISNLAGLGGPGGADFWGIVSDQANIKTIVINEFDGDNMLPDSNIGFDTFRFSKPLSKPIPEPSSVLGILTLGTFGASSLLKRKQQQKVLNSRVS